MTDINDIDDIGDTATQDTEDTKSDVVEESPMQESEVEEIENPDQIDYEALIASDVNALKSEFPELSGLRDITELNNPLRYAALRDLGLTPEEAYLATAKRPTQDTRGHLRSAHGRNAAVSVNMMSQYELAAARDLFPNLSDSEIQRLYKMVNK